MAQHITKSCLGFDGRWPGVLGNLFGLRGCGGGMTWNDCLLPEAGALYNHQKGKGLDWNKSATVADPSCVRKLV